MTLRKTKEEIEKETKGGSMIAPVEEGIIDAVCIGVYDLGFHEKEYQGVKSIVHKISVSWETAETIEEEGKYQGKRKLINRNYNWTYAPSGDLMKDLKTWLGEDIEDVYDADLQEFLVGRDCRLFIEHKQVGEKTYANVISIKPAKISLRPESPLNVTPEWVKKIYKENPKMSEAVVDDGPAHNLDWQPQDSDAPSLDNIVDPETETE